MKLHLSDDLSLPLDAVTQKFGYLAQSGAGKTYAAMKMAELMLGAGAQVVALDPVGVWWGLRADASGRKAGFSIIVMGGEHGDVPLTPRSGELVARVLVDQQISAVLDVSEMTTGETKLFVRDLAEAFFQLKKRAKSPVHIFFEEAQTFAPQSPERDETVMLNRVERLLKLGRNFGVGWSLISQQPQSVNKKVLNQAGTVIALRTLGKHEKKAIVEWVSDKVTNQADLDMANELPGLATGEAYVWSPAWLKVSKRVKISKRETFDASATPEFGVESVSVKGLAKVDVEALRTSMTEAIAEAESEDPKALRARVAKLEAELAKRPTAKVETKTVEVPVLTEKQAEHLQKVAASTNAAIEKLTAALLEVAPGVRLVRQQANPPAPRVFTQPAHDQRQREDRDRALRAAQREALGVEASGLGAGHRAMLIAVAQHPEGADRAQLSVLTGYKRSTRDKLLQQLAAAGMVSQSGDLLVPTPSGVQWLGPDFEPLPTGEALRRYWLQRLPEGEGKLLELVIEHYPEAVARVDLDERAGYKRSTRDKLLQHLAARKLITGDRGTVRASDTLFAERAA